MPDDPNNYRRHPAGISDPLDDNATDPFGHEFGTPDEATGYMAISEDSLPIVDDETSLASISDAAIQRRVAHQPPDDSTVASGLRPHGTPLQGPPPRIDQKPHTMPQPPRADEAPPWRKPSPPKKSPSGMNPRPIPVFESPTTAQRARRSFAQRTKHALIVGGALSAIWSVIVVWVTLSRWLSPTDVIEWSYGGALAIVVASVLVSLEQGRRPRMDDLKLSGRAVTLCIGMLSVFPLLWQFGPLRSIARGFAPPDADVARNVLLDRYDIVVAQECARLAPDYPRPAVQKNLLETLADRPDAVRSCLKKAPEIATLVSDLVAPRWAAELESGEDTARSCRIGNTLEVLERPPGEVETRMLSCIANAPAPVQACCAAILKKHHEEGTWLASVSAGTTWVPDQQTAAALLPLTFADGALTDAQRSLVKNAGFGDVESRRMAVVLSCNAMKEGAKLGPQFINALPADCNVDRSKLPTSNTMWLQACELSKDRLIRRRHEPASALCLAARASATNLAAAEASALLHKARPSERGRRTN